MKVDFHTHWDASIFGVADGGPSAFLEVMDRANLTHAVVLPIAGLLDDRQIGADNDQVAAVCARSGGRMIGLGTANAWEPVGARDETRRCLGTLGLAGMKFHPWLQGTTVNGPGMAAVCAVAQEFDGFLFFHDGTPPFSLPTQIGELASKWPDVRFVLGHCGLLEFWRDALAVLRSQKNVWGCISGPPHAAARQLWADGPKDRLFWGSDFGFGSSAALEYRLDELSAWELGADAEAALLSENPGRFLRL